MFGQWWYLVDTCTVHTQPCALKYKETGRPFSTPVNTLEPSYRLARLQPNVNTQKTKIFPDPAVMEDRSHFRWQYNNNKKIVLWYIWQHFRRGSELLPFFLTLKTTQTYFKGVTTDRGPDPHLHIRQRKPEGSVTFQVCQTLILWPTAWLPDTDISHMVWVFVFVPVCPRACRVLPPSGSKLITVTLGS